jgi:4-alpha-glucanotransferase
MNYQHGTRRLAGVAMPLGAIKTSTGWRVGEYPDLIPFGTLCKAAGLSLIQLLPVNDTGGQSSPYFALSAFALHPIHLRAAALPEASAAPQTLAELDRFAALATLDERYPYHEALDVKIQALRTIFATAQASIRQNPGLADFIAEHPWVKDYAVYKYFKDRNQQRAWFEWPDMREPTRADLDRLWTAPDIHDDLIFHVWVQWRCSQQFLEAATSLADMGLVLLGDLPILMNEDSADVWASREWFDTDLRAGAAPDGEAWLGQNWGFPIYNWQRMAGDDYSFWLSRIREADHYYSAIRIDHVLGFFRIWALSRHDETGYLGHFVPGATISAEALHSAGFNQERLDWLSEPHITGEAWRTATGLAETVDPLRRIGQEDLYRFDPSVRGEQDIRASKLTATALSFLQGAWRDRTLLRIGPDRYVPTWRFRDSRAWSSLSAWEKTALEGLVKAQGDREQQLWETQGRTLLDMLAKASPMLTCAEDLGAIPQCVPRVMDDLGILGLRIPRWTRHWDSPGQPYIALGELPEASICTPSVHDTSTLREWWENAAERQGFAQAYCPALAGTAHLDPPAARTLLAALSTAKSRLFIMQLQDMLDLSQQQRSTDPAMDRINIPGRVDGFNWTWRMRPTAEALLADSTWTSAVRAIVKAGQRL